MAVFGARSIPIENLLLPQYVNDSDDENNNPLLSKNIGSSVIPIDGVVYNIRDKDLICALSMISRGENLYPGSSITICLNFDGCVQPCRFVRAYLHQCENRIDGSRVQVYVVKYYIIIVSSSSGSCIAVRVVLGHLCY